MINTESKLILGLAPVADAFAGTVATTTIDMKTYPTARAIIAKGVGLTGTSTITVEKCSDSSANNPEAIPFYYRRITALGVAGAWTLAEAAGFATTAGSAEVYELAVSDQIEGLAEGDKTFVRVKAVEVVDSPVVGSIVLIGENGRYGKDG